MSKHFGLHCLCVSHSSSWCTKAGELRFAAADEVGIEGRLAFMAYACEHCRCGCDDRNDDCSMDGAGDRLECLRAVATVLGRGGGDSRNTFETAAAVVEDAPEDGDSLSRIIAKAVESSVVIDGNLFVANVVFFLKNVKIETTMSITCM